MSIFQKLCWVFDQLLQFLVHYSGINPGRERIFIKLSPSQSVDIMNLKIDLSHPNISPTQSMAQDQFCALEQRRYGRECDAN